MTVVKPLNWLLTALLVLFLSACSINSSRAPEAGVAAEGSQSPLRASLPGVKIAVLLPLSGAGNTQHVAKALKQAGELALFEFDNTNVSLAAKDTRGTPEGAQAAAREAIAEGAELIIGPLFAAEVAAVAPIAQQAGIPVIAFSSDRNVAGNGVYLLSFVAGSEVPRIVSYAAAQGKRRFASLVPESDFGRILEANFARSVQESGGVVVASARYPADANGMLEPVKQIAALARKGEPAQIDALFMPASPEALQFLAPLFPYFEMDTEAVKLIGNSGWDFQGTGKEKAMLGGWFAAPDPKGWQDFTRRYVETYGDVPPRLASLAYDAVSLAVSLSNNPRGRRFTAQELTRPSGFAGVDGLFRLRPDGLPERGFAILEVQRFGNQIIAPAPTAFTANAQF